MTPDLKLFISRLPYPYEPMDVLKLGTNNINQKASTVMKD
jgi:hypothetical protein